MRHASGRRELSALAKLQPQFVMQMTETVRSKGAEPRKENAMTAIEVQLIERLKRLPPSRGAEVEDFVEFLSQREERAVAAQRLTAGSARLDALNLPPISEDEMEAEIQAARQERRSKQGA